MAQLKLLLFEEKVKICFVCGCEKPLEHFRVVNNTRSADRRSHFCDECSSKLNAKQLNNLYRKIFYSKDPRPSNSYFVQRYGITRKQYDELLEKQDGKCAICCKNEVSKYQRGDKQGKTKALAVDHCHVNGKIRGLLCTNCNRGLGLFLDDPHLLRAAANYIQKSKESE